MSDYRFAMIARQVIACNRREVRPPEKDRFVGTAVSGSNLSFVAMPGDDMAPSISAGELLLLDASGHLVAEPALSAFVLDGQLGVGWAMRPSSDTVAVFFQRRYAPPVALSRREVSRYRHIGQVLARFDNLPSPWISASDKVEMLEQARGMLESKSASKHPKSVPS